MVPWNRFFLSFCFLCQGILVQAQVNLFGTVVDDADGDTLAQVSVYINQTTIGAVTNAQGYFQLAQVPPGNYEIVVSHVGYARLTHRLDVGIRDVRLVFRMTREVKEMREVLVTNPARRQQWIELVRRHLIGQTPAASRTRVLNEEDIFFARTDRSGYVRAFSEVPLVIENREFGYMLHFELMEFRYDASSQETSFYGFSRYENLDASQGERERYARMRALNYRGSTHHFFRALLSVRLENEVYTCSRTPYVPGTREVCRPGDSADANARRVLSNRSVPVSGKELLRWDSARGKAYLQWNGRLTIRFRFDPYYRRDIRNLPGMQFQPTSGTESYVEMILPRVYIDENGVPEDPVSIRLGGFWAYEKLANILPLDYRPVAADR